VVINFGDPVTILTGTSTSGSFNNATITGLPAATITSVLANPTGFYYNLHSTPTYGGGAVRDQLVPEPSVCSLMLLGAVGWGLRRQRAAK